MALNGISTEVAGDGSDPTATKILRRTDKLDLAQFKRSIPDTIGFRSLNQIEGTHLAYVNGIGGSSLQTLSGSTAPTIGHPWSLGYGFYEAFGTTSSLSTTQYVLGTLIYAYSSTIDVPDFQHARVVVNNVEVLDVGAEPGVIPVLIPNITAQAASDLTSLVNTLDTLSGTSRPGTFGLGETLNPGVYQVTGAASVQGVLTLDGQNIPDAIFVIKVGGALTSGATSQMILINGANPANIFWLADGAVALGANTTFYGTAIARPGAASIGAASVMTGRLMSTAGAVSIDGTQPMSVPSVPGPTSIPLGVLESFTMFSSAGAVACTGVSAVVGDVGTNVGPISGFEAPSTINGQIYSTGMANWGGGYRGHSLVVLDPFGDLVSTATYDTWGVPADMVALTAALIAVPIDYIIALVSYDATSFSTEARDSLINNYGSTNTDVWGPSVKDHIFIGVRL